MGMDPKFAKIEKGIRRGRKTKERIYEHSSYQARLET